VGDFVLTTIGFNYKIRKLSLFGERRFVWINVFGVLAVASSLSITFIGFPRQIIRNYRRKNTEGIEPCLIYAAVSSYFFWTVYAWMKPDFFLGTAQTFGLLFALILLIQQFVYRKSR